MTPDVTLRLCPDTECIIHWKHNWVLKMIQSNGIKRQPLELTSYFINNPKAALDPWRHRGGHGVHSSVIPDCLPRRLVFSALPSDRHSCKPTKEDPPS